MNLQRTRYLMIGALATLLANACGSSSSPSSTAPLGLRDEYEAQDALPESGGITEITFYDDTVYSLKQTIGCDAGEALCHEYGTYVLDTSAGTLTLTASTGAVRKFPFSATDVSSTPTTTTASALHTLGGLGGGGGSTLGGGDAGLSSSMSKLGSFSITLVVSFTINGQNFTGDITLTITSGGEGGVPLVGGGDASHDGAALGSGEGGVYLGGGSGSGSGSGSSGGNPYADGGLLNKNDGGVVLGGSGSGSGSSGTGTGTGSGSSGSGGSGSGSGGGGTGTGGSSGSGSGSASGGSGSGSSSGSGSGSGGGSGGTPDAGSSTATALGVDVSHYQGNINWSSVHTANGFAYAKATEGTSYVDTSFGANWQGMAAAGITRGAYHFFRASQDPIKSADFFVQTIANKGGFNAGSDLAPMVDVEVTDGVSAATVIANLTKFINEAQSKLGGGVRLVIYTGPSFWINTLGNPNFSNNPLWIAHYTTAAHPIVPSHWSNYTIWQYTDVITTAGISAGGVDGDRWNGTQSAVQSFVTGDP